MVPLSSVDGPQRGGRLAEVLSLLDCGATEAERPLLRALGQVVFDALPNRLALVLPSSVLAARIRSHFRFIVRDMPPPAQLYRGLPGIHVGVRHSDPSEATTHGGALPRESTLVETHTRDLPFIFETLKNYLRRQGLRIFSGIYPVFTVRRQWEQIVGIGGPKAEGSQECYCVFEIERVDSKERMRRMEFEIYSVLKGLMLAIEDFAPMVEACHSLVQRLSSRRADSSDLEPAQAFLGWLSDENYIFMGTLRYEAGPDGALRMVPESALGAFRDQALLPIVFPGIEGQIAGLLTAHEGDDRILAIDYARGAFALHHVEPIEALAVREWRGDGKTAAVTVLLGRFARAAFATRPDRIPLLRDKLEWVLAESGTKPHSHGWREIRNAFQRFPKTELLYADARFLAEVLDRIVAITADDEIVAHCRRGTGYHALHVAFSRLRYSFETEERLRLVLAEAFGPVAFATSADCGAVTLYLFYFDDETLEHDIDLDRVREIARPFVLLWEDRAGSALERAFGEREGRRLFARYVRYETRSGVYRESTPPEDVPEDVRHLEALESRLEVRVAVRSATSAALTLYSTRALALTETLRVMHNLGLEVTDEMQIPLALPHSRLCHLYRLAVEAPAQRLAALSTRADVFVDALRALDDGRASDDPLNTLVLQQGLSWRDVEVLRTLRNHLLQIRAPYNAETVNDVLLRNPSVAAALHAAFASRFAPGLDAERASRVTEADAATAAALSGVQSLAEDEVLRSLDDLVRATVRTNAYQSPERPVFSIKVDSHRVSEMPSPRPLFEIYVHSRRLEGIHLRGGRVARGGIRWSDRHDDFRTEVLGLMKTQMVKNSVIVPVGSKGGFVLKGDVPPRPALDQYLVERYREFVSGLLDVTDNVVGGAILHPPDVVRRDEGDDPYLVVAADKGTAHLSDTANAVSQQYGFWLGDAFASGGSAGYDHKKMGITARGAWECVKHHFRNLGLDVQSDPFTCAGIGDMAGDVFGNGLLLSRSVRLVAAFNHAHVFVDPSPDPEASYRERARLFQLPRSTWRDYAPQAISAGGGVFDRSAKAISLTPQIRSLLDIADEAVPGETLVKAILRARVDLLYNGGIGTYVKAASETHVAVGDRANDRVRIDATELRARVVGEGGNLGLTQRARLEFWARGGLCNTDAIDNSGGVDTSDHEVNIKILLDELLKKGVVRGREERNRILAEMTDEVADLVLADNASQALALTLDGLRSSRRLEEFVALVEDLAARGILNRRDEAIPTHAELVDSPARERGLPRPLLAVLLGYTKMSAFSALLETDFPDGPESGNLLGAYFPARLREAFPEHLTSHRLRREIVATVAVNHVCNRAGVTFLGRVQAATGLGLGAIVGAYVGVDRAAEAEDLRRALRESRLPSQEEQRLLLAIEEAVEASVREILAGSREIQAPRVVSELRSSVGL